MNGTSAVLSGTFAGRYAIERELGRGGTAVVYFARDSQRDHPVAIKVLRAELAQSVGADRFLKEIRVSQKLHHPQIVPVLDSGNVDGQLFFVLPHMEGGTLRQRLEREKQLPLAEAITITRSIATALAHAHGEGLVHRDVKPENILFTSGQACLADFGIARALEQAVDASTTSTSVIRGTPAYMSPEQASGERQLDGRSDIYSLACVLYEMLAGLPPFVGPSPQSVIAQRLTHPARPLSAFRPGIPDAIEAVLQQAMAIAPADRYQNVGEFIDALDVAASSPHTTLELPRPRRSLALGLAIGAIAIAAAAWVVARPSQSPIDLPPGDPRRVAVLYLDNRSPETIPPYMVDGLTEDLIDQLFGIGELYVISPPGVRQFRDRNVPFDSIARALKVGTIVSGSVEHVGDSITVNVRLADTTGRLTSSEAIRERWSDVLSIHSKLTEKVAFLLRQSLGAELAMSEHRRSTQSPEAWHAAQRARAQLRAATTAGSRNDPAAEQAYHAADSLYAVAERLDPDWEYPALRRARFGMSLALFATLPPPSFDSTTWTELNLTGQRDVWLRRSLALADRAALRWPRSAEALATRGEARYRLMTLGLPGQDSLAPLVEADLTAALAMRDDIATAWLTLAYLKFERGEFLDAAVASRKAYDADPYYEVPKTLSTAFFASLHSERFEDANRWCRLARERYPDDIRFAECPLTVLGWMARTPADARAAARAIQDIERSDMAAALSSSWAYRRTMLAAALARSGDRAGARRVLNEVSAAPPAGVGTALGEAYVHLLLGERTAALAKIGAHLDAAPTARPMIRAHPWFRELRDDPRFVTLVQPAR